MKPLTTNSKLKGYMIGVLGGLCIAPDALVSKLITVDLHSLLFWRALMSAIGFFLICLILYGKKTSSLFKNWSGPNYVVMVAQAIAPTGFVLGIKLTSVVNVLVIFAMTPLIAAFFSWVIWKKKPSLATFICMFIAVIGMGLVVLDGIQQGQTIGLYGLAIPWGEIAAMTAVIALAFAFCVANANPDIHFLPAQSTGTLIMALLFLPFNQIWVLDGYNLALLITVGFVVQACASACLMISTRYITSTESALMLLIETILGPLLVWMVLKEVPTVLALTGGLIILAALIANISFELKRTENLTRS